MISCHLELKHLHYSLIRIPFEVRTVIEPQQDGKLSLEADEATIEGFYVKAEDAMEFRTTYFIVQGDFNAKVLLRGMLGGTALESGTPGGPA